MIAIAVTVAGRASVPHSGFSGPLSTTRIQRANTFVLVVANAVSISISGILPPQTQKRPLDCHCSAVAGRMSVHPFSFSWTIANTASSNTFVFVVAMPSASASAAHVPPQTPPHLLDCHCSHSRRQECRYIHIQVSPGPLKTASSAPTHSSSSSQMPSASASAAHVPPQTQNVWVPLQSQSPAGMSVHPHSRFLLDHCKHHTHQRHSSSSSQMPSASASAAHVPQTPKASLDCHCSHSRRQNTITPALTARIYNSGSTAAPAQSSTAHEPSSIVAVAS